MVAKKTHEEIIVEAGVKAQSIIKGEKRGIYHLEHLEQIPLPVGFKEEPVSTATFAVAGDCCGMIFAEDPVAKPRRIIEEPYEDPSY